MDTARFILVLAIALVTMMLWQAWQKDYGTQPEQASQAAPPSQLLPKEVDEGDAPKELLGEMVAGEEETVAPPSTLEKGEMINVRTDLFHIEIGLQGGGIRKAALIRYPVAIDKPEEPFVLMDDSRELTYITQGGLLSRQIALTHKDNFMAPQQEFALEEGQDTLEVPLTFESTGGLKVTKVYRFTRGSYLINVKYMIENGSGETWQGRAYTQIKRSGPASARKGMIYTYTGAVISSPEKRYEKVKFDEIREKKREQEITDGWVAMIQHYFVTALVPGSKTDPYLYYTKALADGKYAIGALTPQKNIASGAQDSIEEQIYVGPKVQKVLANVAEGLELTVDYGVLWFLAKPLFWCLGKFHQFTGNWGWAIILVTVMLKVLFYRLSAAGYRSMAKMRRVQPRIVSIRERYKSDKTRLNQAMMQIYKEEKINPLGGCFPILIQIPVFIALYWVLLESVEMRQSGFIFWLTDLSSPDRFYVLPLLMGITMFIQQKLNPAPMDPVQEKVMMILPFAFTIFFAFFPSGLVLYWVVNNVLSIAQQWLITRSLERAGLGAKPS